MIKSSQASCSIRWSGVAISVCVVGVMIRLAIASLTIGSNDTSTWMKFGLLVNQYGLVTAYFHDEYLNHPPIPTLWAAACYAMTWWEPRPFAFLMRLPAIAGDLLSCVLLWRILSVSHGAKVACVGVAVFALSPAAILVSAYHCNTDSLCIALTLLALYVASKRRWGWAGFALGAAINIKLVPVFIIPVLLLRCTGRERWRCLGGLAVWTIPFLILFALGGMTTVKNIVGYGSSFENWGLLALFRLIAQQTDTPALVSAAWVYHDHVGKWLMLVAIVLSALLGRRRLGLVDAGAQTNAWFLALSPGFGIQYLVYATTLMLASAPRWGFYVAAAGGTFATSVYYIYLETPGDYFSKFTGGFPFPVYAFGLATWAIIFAFAITRLTCRGRPGLPPTPPPANQ